MGKSEKKSSNGFLSPFESDPDFVNERGVKWWIDKSMTSYARSPDEKGTELDAVCFFVEETNGRRTRLLTLNGMIIEDEQNLEQMAMKIDIRKFLSRENASKKSAALSSAHT